ncbi:MAG: hypothetical protein AAGB04_17915 [Pseudomonadota bacterium]
MGRATEISFWLEYWISTYAMLSTLTCDHIVFVSHDRLLAEPMVVFEALLNRLEIVGDVDIASLVTKVRREQRSVSIPEELDPERLKVAQDIHALLTRRASP